MIVSKDNQDGKKVCTKCGEEKLLKDFYASKLTLYGRKACCKVCVDKRTKNWKTKNSERNRENERIWRKNNPEKTHEYGRRSREKNPEKCIESGRRWRKDNPDREKEFRRRSNAKLRSTIKGRLSARMAERIRNSLNGGKGGRHWESLIGYTAEQLKRHIEKQFIDGMTWNNMGAWHIDHKIPVSVHNFNSVECIDFLRCWSLKNLRPMWAVENRQKNNKLDRPFQPSLCI